MGSVRLNWRNGYERSLLGWAEHQLGGEENSLCIQGKDAGVSGVNQGGALPQDALQLICLFNTLSEADLKVGVCCCHRASNTCDTETLEPEDIIQFTL